MIKGNVTFVIIETACLDSKNKNKLMQQSIYSNQRNNLQGAPKSFLTGLLD